MNISKLYNFIFLLCFSGFVSANAIHPIVLQSDISQILLTPHATYYKETKTNLSITDITNNKLKEFTPLLKKDINQGFTDDVFWLKVQLHNPSDNDFDWIISHETSYLDVMTIYVRTNEDSWQKTHTTDHDIFSQRSVPYRKLNFSHSTPAKQTTELLIKLQMINLDALTLAVKLQTQASFNQTLTDEQFFYGIYFGISLTLILISLIFSITLKKKLYFSYFLYLVTHLIFWGFVTGHIFQYVLPGFPSIYNQGFNIAFLLFFISALQFSKQFLNTSLYSPKVDKLLTYLQIFSVLAIVLRLAGVYELILHISHLSLIILILLPVVGWLAYRKGLKYARWYILAWAIYGIGILLSVLSAATNLFNWGMEPIVYTQVMSLLESFLLMLAIADKVDQVNKKLIIVTEEAQHDALTTLGNRRLLASTFNQISLYENTPKNYWCLVLDVDDFKQLNDTYGHVLGDTVLQNLALIFNQICRPEDLVIRYGGEEFVILIKASDINIVKHIAERIRAGVEASVIIHNGAEVRTTISIGISAVSFEHNMPFELSFENADKALYQVKHTTKNGIAIFHNSEITQLPS